MDTGGTDTVGKYLFLLSLSEESARIEAVRYLQELGVKILHRDGDVALVGLARPEQVEAAAQRGLFATITRQGVKPSHGEQMSPEQQAAVALWNASLSPEIREIQADLSEVGKSWSTEDRGAPGPSTSYDPVAFRNALVRELDLNLEELEARNERLRSQQIGGEAFVALERGLEERFGDATVAYHLARLLAQLGPAYVDVAENLSQEFVDGFFAQAAEETACWSMEGEIAVGVVFVESSRAGGPTFSSSKRSTLQALILDGLDWLAEQAPTRARLTWVYDWQFVTINVANGSDTSQEDYWRDPAMGEVRFQGTSYSADWDGVAAYREDLRQHNGSAHAMAVFVTPYANWWHAYAGGGRITLAERNNWENWGIQCVDEITAHEACHLFNATDEYGGDDGTPCSSCRGAFGCFGIPNGNCEACARPHQDCVMSANSRRLCAYTQGQIGWADLFVELTTADVHQGGTDDAVWLDIGDRVFRLDSPNHDDRERGNVEGYALNYTGLTSAHIKRVGIRKAADGTYGGWRLQRVRLWNRGTLVCDENNINVWLEDTTRWWVSARCGSGGGIVNQLRAEITTGDVSNAGTDDDVRLTLGGRSWNLDNPGKDDFERGDTNVFDLDPGTGLYVASISSIRIHKAPDGSYGGWRLGGVRLRVNGQTLYNNQQINQWLEDDDRDWIGMI
jgi:hypothetical protein